MLDHKDLLDILQTILTEYLFQKTYQKFSRLDSKLGGRKSGLPKSHCIKQLICAQVLGQKAVLAEDIHKLNILLKCEMS